MKIYLYCLFTILTTGLAAQQSSRFLQSADDFGTDNPAGLSIEEMRYKGTTVSTVGRNQWWAFNNSGHPQTQYLSWLENTSERHQLGAMLMADKIGETRQFSLTGRYAHSLSKGLKIGISAGIFSNRIYTENLDVYDESDPIVSSAGEIRWRYMVGAGLFYSIYDRNASWNGYAGASFRYLDFTSQLETSSSAPAEADFLFQGGLGWRSWWTGGRIRLSLHQPSAFDVYVRNYFLNQKFFVGGIGTSDTRHYTVGANVGHERLLRSNGTWNNHYLTLCVGLSKPLSKYIEGSNLILDVRIIWSHQRRPN